MPTKLPTKFARYLDCGDVRLEIIVTVLLSIIYIYIYVDVHGSVVSVVLSSSSDYVMHL